MTPEPVMELEEMVVNIRHGIRPDKKDFESSVLKEIAHDRLCLLMNHAENGTILNTAAALGWEDIVHVILYSISSDDRVKLIRICSRGGVTCIHQAVTARHTSIVKLILSSVVESEQRLALLTIMEAGGRTPLCWAVDMKLKDVVKVIANSLDIEHRDALFHVSGVQVPVIGFGEQFILNPPHPDRQQEEESDNRVDRARDDEVQLLHAKFDSLEQQLEQSNEARRVMTEVIAEIQGQLAHLAGQVEEMLQLQIPDVAGDPAPTQDDITAIGVTFMEHEENITKNSTKLRKHKRQINMLSEKMGGIKTTVDELDEKRTKPGLPVTEISSSESSDDNGGH